MARVRSVMQLSVAVIVMIFVLHEKTRDIKPSSVMPLLQSCITNSCGTNAQCHQLRNGSINCVCPKYYIGDPLVFCKLNSGDCLLDADCIRTKRCLHNKCAHRAVSIQQKKCPRKSPKLDGLRVVVVDEIHLEQVNNEIGSTVEIGGKYKPVECRSNHKVAIIVPYRNRETQLPIFLRHMHIFLQRQQIEYTIFIVEEANNESPFNRGMLANIGYTEALKIENFGCFIIHDVDMLPEDDRHLYVCPEDGKPRQLAVLVEKFNYIPFRHFIYFGGVTAFSTSDFRKINGFSNEFWGWGAEDDDMYQRVIFHGMNVTFHEPEQEARYKSLTHKEAEHNPLRFEILNKTQDRLNTDGLSNLRYRLLLLQRKPLFTHIKVNCIQNKM